MGDRVIDYTTFLERYCYEDILKLAQEYPDRKMLEVDFSHLVNYDLEASSRLLDHPDSELKSLTAALRDYPLPIDSLEQATVSIKNLPSPEKIPIHRIGSGQVSKLIAIEGRINKVGHVKAKLLVGAFKCQRCEHISLVQQSDNGKFIEPFECENDVCGRKGNFKLKHEESTWVDEQKIELQDLYENLKPGQLIREIIVIVRGRDLIESVPAIGAQVIISGIPRTIQKVSNGGLSSLFSLVVEAVHIEVADIDINVTLTEADKKELQQLAANSNIFDMLVQSTAPTILGYPEIKLALLAAAVSGPNQRYPNGGHYRGYIHIAICGDPGTGKTEMVDDLRRKVPRSQYAAGKQTSVAGLTVTAIRDELSGSGYTAQAGALVLADKGLMVIDELDKFEREDIQALNTVMERGSFEYHKGVITKTFNARCPIIAVGNPKDIRFDKYEEDLSKQIDIPSDTLSRFDLIFKIQDIPEPDRDRKIAEHIDKLLGQVGSTKEMAELPISIETMQKYLAYAKTFEPVVPEDVAKRTTGYYLELRQSKDGTISATARDKYGLIRLTKSIAKLRLSNECNIEDVNRAIAIHRAALEAIKDPTTGNPDIDILFGMGKSQRDRIKIVREIIQELQSSDGGRAFFDDIVSIAAGKSITKDQAVDILEHLKKQGDIIEIKNDCYRVA